MKMKPFPYMKLVMAFAAFLISGFLALSLPFLNREQDQRIQLLTAIKQSVFDIQSLRATQRDYQGLGQAYNQNNNSQNNNPPSNPPNNPWGLFRVLSSQKNLEIRLTQISDSVCRFLVDELFMVADIIIIEDDDDIVAWDRHRQKKESQTQEADRQNPASQNQNRIKPSCINQPNRHKNALALFFH